MFKTSSKDAFATEFVTLIHRALVEHAGMTKWDLLLVESVPCESNKSRHRNVVFRTRQWTHVYQLSSSKLTPNSIIFNQRYLFTTCTTFPRERNLTNWRFQVLLCLKNIFEWILQTYMLRYNLWIRIWLHLSLLTSQ